MFGVMRLWAVDGSVNDRAFYDVMNQAVSAVNVDEIETRRRQGNMVRAGDYDVISTARFQRKLPERFGPNELFELFGINHICPKLSKVLP